MSNYTDLCERLNALRRNYNQMPDKGSSEAMTLFQKIVATKDILHRIDKATATSTFGGGNYNVSLKDAIKKT